MLRCACFACHIFMASVPRFLILWLRPVVCCPAGMAFFSKFGGKAIPANATLLPNFHRSTSWNTGMCCCPDTSSGEHTPRYVTFGKDFMYHLRIYSDTWRTPVAFAALRAHCMVQKRAVALSIWRYCCSYKRLRRLGLFGKLLESESVPYHLYVWRHAFTPDNRP